MLEMETKLTDKYGPLPSRDEKDMLMAKWAEKHSRPFHDRWKEFKSECDRDLDLLEPLYLFWQTIRNETEE